VASGLLQRGARLSADQVTLMDMPTQGLPPNVLDRVDDVLHAELLRDIPAGTPLRSQDIRPALMVKRGQLVMVSAGSERGFRVVARLEALQDGRMGEQIKLKNRESGRQISGVITGMNAADAL
jgi:flagella basal body P-ring formation protein FlgA